MAAHQEVIRHNAPVGQARRPSPVLTTATTTSVSSPNGFYYGQASTAGGGLTGVTLLSSNVSGAPLLELVRGEAGAAFALPANAGLISTSPVSFANVPSATTDIVQVQPGFYVVASAVNGLSLSNVPVLTALLGVGGDLSNYGTGNQVFVAQIPGTVVAANATIGETRLLSLGDGRILVVWGSYNGGGGATAVSGVYAVVFNMNTSQAEDTPTLLRAFTDVTGSNFSIEVAQLADGRVAVTHSTALVFGLTGYDVFSAVLDTRVHGIEVVGTAGADSYVGSAFDDVFLNTNFNDTIVGGNGRDSVTVGGTGVRQIDLADPDAFVGGGPVMSGVENVTTGSGNDLLYGNLSDNLLNAGNGNDWIDGRAGNDSLIGGQGDDTVLGGDGADTLDGGTNNDLMAGGGR